MRLFELYDDDKKAKKLKSKRLPEGWEDIEKMFHYQGFPYIPKIICSKLISRYHDDSFVKSLWHKKDSRADNQQVLLVNIMKRCWGLRQALQRLLNIKSSQTQAPQ